MKSCFFIGHREADERLLPILTMTIERLIIEEQVLNPLSPSLATTYSNMGDLYGKQGKYDEALKLFEKALKIREQVLDPLSPRLAISYNNIGLAYHKKGNNDEALKWLEKAVHIQEQVLDPLSDNLAISYVNIGFIYFRIKNYDKALKYFNKALPGCIKNFGEENDNTKMLEQWIEECKQALGE